ncbi:MAG: helix-turn-helix transcriptional regulator [Ktedonobacteraceae bacterium]
MPEGKVQRRLYPNNLKHVIHLHGYKVVEVADELQLSRSTLYDYVSGYRPAPKQCLKSIAQLLDCEVNEFRYDQPAQASHVVPDESSLPAESEQTAETRPSGKEPHTAASEKEPHLLLLALPMQTHIPVTDADYAVWFGK